jgi:hypothetical protein
MSQYRSVVSIPGIGGTFIAPKPVATITVRARIVSPPSQVTANPLAARLTWLTRQPCRMLRPRPKSVR